MNFLAQKLSKIILFAALPLAVLTVFFIPQAQASVPINNISVSAIKTDSVNISWDSTSAGTSIIEYGTTASYGSINAEDPISYFHVQTITGLNSGTAYHYRIRTKDIDNAETISGDYTFTTRTQAELEAVIKAARNSQGAPTDLPQTFYVSPTGNDSLDGLSTATAWQKPSVAVSRAYAGDTVMLMDGTWLNEHVVFSRSGIDVAPIALTVYNNSAPIFNGAGTIERGIEFINCEWIVINGITVIDYTNIGVYTNPGSSHITIKNVTTGINGWGGIQLSGHDSIIKNSLDYNSDMTGIKASGYNNYVIDSTVEQRGGMPRFSDYGFASGGSSHNITYKNNTAIAQINGGPGYGHAFATASGATSLDPSPYNIVFDGFTLINPGLGFEIRDQSKNIIIRNGKIINAKSPNGAVYIEHNASDILVENVVVDTALYPFSIGSAYYGKNVTFKNCIAINTTNIYATGTPIAFKASKSNGVSIINCIAYGSWSSGDATRAFVLPTDASKSAIIKNNIAVGFQVGVTGGSHIAVNNTLFYNVTNPFSGAVNGIGNIIGLNPLFVDPASGDFHLKSKAGRWNGTIWVTDSVTSPAIDAGDPTDYYFLEPSPNGGRINMGAYGNTVYASKTPNETSPTPTPTPIPSLIPTPTPAPVPFLNVAAYWKLNELSGASAADSSGNSNNGTLTNFQFDAADGWIAGKVNNGLKFDGVNDYINAGNGASLNAITVGGSYSISMWFNASDVVGSRQLFGKTISSSDRMSIYLSSSTLRANHYNGSSYLGVKSGSVSANAWYFMVYTYENGIGNLYLNAISQSGTSTAFTSNTLGTRIGASLGSQYYFSGLIDEVKIYSRALTSSEIMADYNAGISLFSSADFNSDGYVNSVDFGILMSNWNSTVKPKADINQDSIVNSVDFGIMMSEWGG